MSLSAICLSILIIPMIWQTGLLILRRFLPSLHGDDFSEKMILVLLVAPYLVALTGQLIPMPFEPAELTFPEWTGLGENFAGPITTNDLQSASMLDFSGLFLWGLLSVYIAIAAFRLFKLSLAVLALRHEERSSESLDQDVLLSQTGKTAFASLNGKVILARSLHESLQPEGLALILSHERAHLARRDPHFFLALSVLDCLFWFNPLIRFQTDRCRQAAELSCDERVLKGQPEMRSVYAHMLVTALKHTAGNARPCVPAAFSPRQKGDYRMRIQNIMQPQSGLRKSARNAIMAAASVCLLPIAGLQLALADGATPKAFEMLAYPVEGRITSTFGPRIQPITKQEAFHNGMDIAAATGTPIKAPAGGTVLAAEFRKGYGNLMIIDHGNGYVTRYGQMDSFSVKPGDHVISGQEIGKVGQSGQATGPHLHFEVLQNDENLDPQSFLIQ